MDRDERMVEQITIGTKLSEALTQGSLFDPKFHNQGSIFG